jgi:hypothetical protein
MGREIRMVPPNWEHPRYGKDETLKHPSHRHGEYKPMHDRSYEEVAQEWKDGLAAWESGERPDYCSEEDKHLEYWEWEGAPPEREYYRPAWPEGSATWFQVYETVSEGTPITPPFATKAELVDYLCTHKDFWNKGPLTRTQAEAFVESEYAPSLMVSGGVITEGMEIPAAMAAERT